MNETEIIKIAEAFLTARMVQFVKSGNVLQRTRDTVEVSFPVPEALDPNAIIDPPDVKVLVHLNDGRCELVHQM